jgi:hypothetical protein
LRCSLGHRDAGDEALRSLWHHDPRQTERVHVCLALAVRVRRVGDALRDFLALDQQKGAWLAVARIERCRIGQFQVGDDQNA